MAKKSMVERDLKRRRLAKKFENKRTALKAIIRDENASGEDKFKATLKLAELPRNSSKTRIRNRCEVTGRPRGYYRKLRMSRIALREFGSKGLIPGLVKSSW
jgi:small subunit ribosomal protein S14